MDLIYFILIILILIELYLRIDSKYKRKENVEKSNKKLQKKTIEYPYKLNDSLLNKYEQNFYTALRIILNETKYSISFKVSLISIFNSYAPVNYVDYIDKLKYQYIDFVIYDKNTFEPILLIDLVHLDDSKENVIPTNDFLYYCCKSSKIKLVRFKEMRTYTTLEIKDKLGIILE